MADDLTKPYFGNPNVARQGAQARQLAQQRAAENLPDPRTYGFVQGLLGTSPEQLGMSVLSPNTAPAKEAAYAGYQLSNAAQVAPAIKGLFSAAKALPAVVQDLRGTPLPSVFVHGTTPENAAAIRAAGQFNPNVGERVYDYSQFGRQASYFAPEGSWWLDPEKAAAGRAATYKDSVKMQLDPSAKIKVVDSEKQLNKLAKKAGFVDAYDMMSSLNVDGLQSLPFARKAQNMTYEQYLQDYIDSSKEGLVRNGWEGADKIKTYNDLFKFYEKNNLPAPADLGAVYQDYEQMRNYEATAFREADAATKQLLDAGVEGVYISPKYGDSVRDPLANWHPASDQLALFKQERAKLVNPAYKDPFGDTTK